jgi:hypothetical protein
VLALGLAVALLLLLVLLMVVPNGRLDDADPSPDLTLEAMDASMPEAAFAAMPMKRAFMANAPPDGRMRAPGSRESMGQMSQMAMADEGERVHEGRGEGHGEGLGPDGGVRPVEGAKRIVVGHLEARVASDRLAGCVAAIAAAVEAVDGYVQQQTTQAFSAALTLRMPVAKYDAVVKAVKTAVVADGSGRLAHEQRSVDDVTLQYTDQEARLASIKTSHTTLLALLAQAKGVQDVLAVQRELAHVQQQLDSHAAMFKHLQAQVAYSTLHVSLTVLTTPPEPVRKPGTLQRALASVFATGATGAAAAHWLAVYGTFVVLPIAAVFYLLLACLAPSLRNLLLHHHHAPAPVD